MSRDVMLHVSQSLCTDELRSLGAHVDRRMGVEAKAHASSKPHLFFFKAIHPSPPGWRVSIPVKRSLGGIKPWHVCSLKSRRGSEASGRIGRLPPSTKLFCDHDEQHHAKQNDREKHTAYPSDQMYENNPAWCLLQFCEDLFAVSVVEQEIPADEEIYLRFREQHVNVSFRRDQPLFMGRDFAPN